MKATLTHVRLLVNDYVGCFRFYRDVLGFAYQGGDESGPYVEFIAGENVYIALFYRAYMSSVAHTDNLPDPVPSKDLAVLCLEVDDVDATAADLKSKGVTLVNEPMDMESWIIRVAHFRDPDGNLIEINQPLAQA
jgi:catechol 2,3-dioxygenase-like lactoylglutathione lyase family enzyme